MLSSCSGRASLLPAKRRWHPGQVATAVRRGQSWLQRPTLKAHCGPAALAPRAEGQLRVRGYRKQTFTSMWAWSWS